MENESRFQSFYYNQLEPQLYAFEADRKKIVNKTFITLIAFIFAYAILIVVFLNDTELLAPIAIIAFTLFIIAFFVLKYFYAKKYKKQFKQNIISLLLSYFKKDLQYFPEQKIPQNTFTESQIFNQAFNRYNGEDLITGTTDGIPVSFSELNVQHQTGSGKNRHTHTIFDGVFLVIQMPLNHFGNTIILPDTAEKLFGSKIGNFFQGMGKSRGTLVKIDDREFEKEFVVYGSNPDSTLSLLNNTLVENLLNLKKRVGKKIYVSFIGNMAYVAVTFSENMFEPRVFRKIRDFNYMNTQAEYIEFFTNIAKMLNNKRN